MQLTIDMGKQEYDFHFIWKVNYGRLAYFVNFGGNCNLKKN
jgi:hypothetical protein